MGFFTAITRNYANILNFSGRASRSEYWWFVLFQSLVIFGAVFGMVYYFITVQPPNPEALAQRYGAVLNVGYLLFLWLPGLSSLVRRLHDTDHSGWWMFISVIPIIGALVLLFFLVMPGTEGRNRYLSSGGKSISKPKVRLPRGMKPAPTEAERRAEILEYYKKNVAAHGQPT